MGRSEAESDPGGAGASHGFPNLAVIEHPLIRHKLGILRSRDTPKKLFRELLEEITLLMAYEVTRDLAEEPVEIETPLEVMRGTRVRGSGLVIVPVLRAGLGMVDGILRLIPGARVGHIGLKRDEASLEPTEYYFNVPAQHDVRRFVILDPMLATGGSASTAVAGLKAQGARRISLMCVVAAPEGVGALLESHPDVRIHAATLDRELNDVGYILPGLGDAGDRLFGT